MPVTFLKKFPTERTGFNILVEVGFQPLEDKIDAVGENLDQYFENDLENPSDDHQGRENDGDGGDPFDGGADTVNGYA